jgi:hypothetical protein
MTRYEIRPGFRNFSAVFGSLLAIIVVVALGYGVYDSFASNHGLPFLSIWPVIAAVFLLAIPFLFIGFWPEKQRPIERYKPVPMEEFRQWAIAEFGIILVSVSTVILAWAAQLLVGEPHWTVLSGAFFGSILLTTGIFVLRGLQKRRLRIAKQVGMVVGPSGGAIALAATITFLALWGLVVVFVWWVTTQTN